MSLQRPNQKRTAAPIPQPLGADDDDGGPNLVLGNPSSSFSSLSPSQPAEETPTPAASQQTSADPTAHSGGGLDPDSDTANDLVNMYFLILGAFAIVLVIGIWYWRRGKKRKQLESAGRRHHALVLDLEMGRQRGAGGSARTGAAGWLGLSRGEREEEGVDERGEAPPPYAADTSSPAEGQVLAAPESAHVREGGGVLPKYEELRESPGRGSQSSRTPESGEPMSAPRADEGSGGGAGQPSTLGIIRPRNVTDASLGSDTGYRTGTAESDRP